MSIAETYLELLDHLGPTVPVRTLHEDTTAPNVVALRHDIDHDLKVAIEMAAIEHERGVRATYYLLHTHDYWRDPNFLRRCLQLQAYGHEVALHLNLLTDWINTPDRAGHGFAAEVHDLLAPLREAGVVIDGVSAHGDRACYEHGFVNYWIWRELRADDPVHAERGKSAEGIAVDDPRWQVPYPPDHRITAPDGRTLELWQERLADCGLAYDAAHVRCDGYWTDSGGRWDRRGDPREHDLARGRHQVLVHPVWWQGPRRLTVCAHTSSSSVQAFNSLVDRATSTRVTTLAAVLEADGKDDATPCDRSERMRRLRRWLIRQRRPQQGDGLLMIPSDQHMLALVRREAPDACILSVTNSGADDAETAAFAGGSFKLPGTSGSPSAHASILGELGFTVHPLLLDSGETPDRHHPHVRWFPPASAPASSIVTTIEADRRPAMSAMQIRARFDRGVIFVRLRRSHVRGELLFGEGTSSQIEKGGGYPLSPRSIFRCHFAADLPSTGTLRAFANFYGKDRIRTSLEELGTLSAEQPRLVANFVADPGAVWFTISLHYVPAAARDVTIIRTVDVEQTRVKVMPPGALAANNVGPHLASR